MSRIHNFGAGPSMLPAAVLERIREDLPCWSDAGMSVMEMSHRGAAFLSIAEQAEARVRRLLSVPDDYYVLFMQGGASMQFACVPLNLLRGRSTAAYLDTGHWSQRAMAEAKRLCGVKVAASGADGGYTGIPPRARWRLDRDSAYLHYTANETIGGVEFQDVPDIGTMPLVSDMSSNLLSAPLDVRRLSLVYAGAQKNLGIAGLTIVLGRKDLCGLARAGVPTQLDYQTYATTGSMSNTPPCFAWYVAGLVFEWIEVEGGLPAMAERNRLKANALYSCIDGSGFYRNGIDPACRSRMNVPFMLSDTRLDAVFLAEAEAEGLRELKGHRAVGGMRASLYNAMPQSGVDALVSFMQEFVRRHG